jgi:hypothetical protein
VFRIAIQRTLGDLNGEVQDGRTAIVEAGPPVIQGDTVGKDGVAQGLQPGSDANSTACLTKQFFGGRVLTGMSSTKRIWGFLVRIIHERSGGPRFARRELDEYSRRPPNSRHIDSNHSKSRSPYSSTKLGFVNNPG